MSVPVVGRVWIRYPVDPSVGYAWEITREDGWVFDDAVSMQITVAVNQLTTVDIMRKRKTFPERYELIAVPHPARHSQCRTHIPTETTVGAWRCLSCMQTSERCECRHAAAAAKPCVECSGSGYYVSPVTGKRSPCSAGCKP
jgi:hypothetical protein